jgi:shikimate kinase
MGFMTSGKSTLGKILANVLGWDFADLDKVIEQSENLKITQIFEKKGEKYFRELEEKNFFEICEKEFIVISLGGGTVENANIIKNISEIGLSIYLSVSLEILYQRLKRKIDRPLIRDLVLSGVATKEDFMIKINELFLKREPIYKSAEIQIPSDTQQVGKTIDIIVNKIKRRIDEKY